MYNTYTHTYLQQHFVDLLQELFVVFVVGHQLSGEIFQVAKLDWGGGGGRRISQQHYNTINSFLMYTLQGCSSKQNVTLHIYITSVPLYYTVFK